MNRFIFAIIIPLFLSINSFAGIFELSAELALNRSNYNDGSYTSTRRYGLSLGYFFTQDSELEFSFQDSNTKTVVTGIQDVTFHDQVYTLDLNYFLLDSESTIRPFIKGGAGQLNRDATGSYTGGGRPPGRTDQLTAVLGAGFRVKISERLGFKSEFNTYLAGGAISTWKDNLAFMFGGSFLF